MMCYLYTVLVLFACNFKGIMVYNAIDFIENVKPDDNSNKAIKWFNSLQSDHDVDEPVIKSNIPLAPGSKLNDDTLLQKNGIMHRIRNKQPVYNGKLDELKSINELELKLNNSKPDLIDNVLNTQEYINVLKKSVAKHFSKYKSNFDVDTINNNRNKFIFKRHASSPPGVGKSQKEKRKQHKIHVNSSIVKKQSYPKQLFDKDESNKCSDRTQKKKECETTLECTTTCKTTSECTTTCAPTTSETTTAYTTEAACEPSTTECSTEAIGCDPGFLEPKPTKKRKPSKTTPSCETEEEADCQEETTDCLAPTAPKCKTSEQCDDADDDVDDLTIQKYNEVKK